MDPRPPTLQFKHYTVTLTNTYFYLLNLLQEELSELKIHLHASFLDGVIQNVIIRTRQLDAGKQVRCDAVKQRQVVVEKLRQVDINYGT